MKILVAFGTRPEWLKLKPLLEKFLDYDIDFDCLYTGQHEDLLEPIDCKYKIEIPANETNRLDQVCSTILSESINWIEYNYVLVQGDTVSAFIVALKAFNNNNKIIHLEAGLRTNNTKHPFPEEGYRQMLSRIACINLCPTTLSLKNLEEENIIGEKYVVGNTVLDNLNEIKAINDYSNIVFVSLHRRENHEIIKRWFYNLDLASKSNENIKFVFSVHPNPNITKNIKILGSQIKCVKPLKHKLLINILTKCKFIITDSGGLQEEGAFLNKKIIVCRKYTERAEGIDSGHIIMCKSPEELPEKISDINKKYKIKEDCPFGDGKASQKICEILIKKESWKPIKPKNFSEEIKKFENYLIERKSFSFSRFSDGELFVLQNRKLKLSENHWSLEDNDFIGNYTKEERKEFDPIKHQYIREYLLESYLYDKKNYYKGISCKCCVGEENYAWGLHYLSLDELSLKKVLMGKKKNITWSNLFINNNYPYYIQNILPLFSNYDVYFVVNENAGLDELPFTKNIKKVFHVGENCMVNNLELKEKLPLYIKKNKIKNSLFLFSAASLSNILIHHCHLAEMENFYIDIGSSLNPIMRGMEGWRYNRDYLNNYWNGKKTDNGGRNCVW